MRDRTAERGQAQLEKDAEYFPNRTMRFTIRIAANTVAPGPVIRRRSVVHHGAVPPSDFRMRSCGVEANGARDAAQESSWSNLPRASTATSFDLITLSYFDSEVQWQQISCLS
jgi:hypothetical protein